MRKRVVKWTAAAAGLLVLAAAGAVVWERSRDQARVLAQVDLGDGRVLRIEGMTFRKEHQIGHESLIVQRLGPWLPAGVRDFLAPRVPRSRMTADEPVLVVWVNAVDAATGKQVDCQGVRLEFVGPEGYLFGERTAWRSFHGNFWRVGHQFTAFPRGERILKLRITSWRAKTPVEVELENPAYTTGEAWEGEPLPLVVQSGDYEVVLAGLEIRERDEKYYVTPARYWEPKFELRRGGVKQEGGWDIEWTARDRFGSYGQALGMDHPALKFSAVLTASATNVPATVLITKSPMTEASAETNVWWNAAGESDQGGVTLLGFFPAGEHTFSEGKYLTNSPVPFAPAGGRADSGWVVATRQETPFRKVSYDGHYSGAPVVYLKLERPENSRRIGVRLRDESGRVWLAERESQGYRHGIVPFIVKLPDEAGRISVEVVRLEELTAEFLAAVTGTPE